ncbi:MAG TPA: membrane protein insertase YidC [Clostridia bacterium]
MVNVIAEFFMTTFWKWVLLKALAFIQNYGLRVILLTVALKIITFPLDFFSRKKTLDNAKIMEKMRPELERLNKQYANNPAELQKRTSALYKKYGYGAFSTCLSTLLTFFIFITLIYGYTGTAQVINEQRYEKLYEVYTTYVESPDTQEKVDEANANNNEWIDFQIALLSDSVKKDKTEEEILKIIETKLGYSGIERGDNVFTLENIQSADLKLRQYEEVVKYVAQKLVYEEYEAHSKDSFLWIKNIWRPDTWVNPIPSQKEFYSSTKINEDAKADYNAIMGVIQYKYKGQWNGYLILVFLSVGLNILNTFLSLRQQKNAADPNTMGSMKIMMIMMPFMIGYFALSQSSAFTLYMTVNSLMTLLVTLATNGILKLLDQKKEQGSPYRRRVVK